MIDRPYSSMIATYLGVFITCAVNFIQKSLMPDSVNQEENRRVKLEVPPFPGMKPEGVSSKPRAGKRMGMKEMCFAHEEFSGVDYGGGKGGWETGAVPLCTCLIRTRCPGSSRR
jgi:hypothetical protein